MEELVIGARKLGIKIDVERQRLFGLYYQELLDWNKKFNLTAIIDYKAVQVKHFLDSLTVISVFTEEGLTEPQISIIDVGTGAGFPGIPLKIVIPQVSLTLLDSTAKKTAFLVHIVKKMQLSDVNVVVGRAEEVAHLPLYRQQFDLVVSRAVAPMSTLVELTLPFCRIGGRLVAYKKGKIKQEIEKAKRAIDIMGGKFARMEKVDVEELGEERCLVVVEKVRPTPDKYPRRSGIPTRRPISDV
jgi:16S rRNA (guanine527-N7)-methyltransferase